MSESNPYFNFEIPPFLDEERIELSRQAREMQRVHELGMLNPRSYSDVRDEYENDYRNRGRRFSSHYENMDRVFRLLIDKINQLEIEVLDLRERLDSVDFYRE